MDYYKLSPKEADAYDSKRFKKSKAVGRTYSECGHKSERM